MPLQHRHKIFTFITFAFWATCVCIIQFYVDLNLHRIAQDEQRELRREVTLIRSKIESAIYEDVYLASTIATVLRVNTEVLLENWSEMADQLMKKSTHIRNIGIAPNNVISHVYPVEGNEAVINLDFKTVPQQYAAVMTAKRSGDVYLDGPIELVQGGKALIARYPIFLDYPNNQNYWGSTSVVLNYDNILHESGIFNIRNANIAIYRKTVHGQKEVFLGNEQIFSAPDELLPIYLPNNQWLMAIKSTSALSEFAKSERSKTQFLGFVVSLILYLSIFALYRAYHIARTASFKDELTHLYNRRYLFAQLEQRMKRTNKQTAFSLLNIDLNEFKHVNDQWGHEAGDALLIHVAQSIQHHLNRTDFVARVGGDEFLVLLDSSHTKVDAIHRAQTLKQIIEKQPLQWKDSLITASVSIGAVTYTPDHPMTQEALLNTADRSMYHNKKARKGATV